MPSTPRKIKIGRDAACDVVLADRSVSRKHADLLVDSAGAMEVLDLDSSGGTYLIRGGKDESVARAKLKPGDVVRFGELEVSFQDLQARVDKLAPPVAAEPPKKLAPPPLPKKVASAVPAAGGRMVRCECGSIKKKGSPCPSCGI